MSLRESVGKTVRIGPNEVSLASPKAARAVFTAGKGFYKTAFYGVFPPPENPDIFTETRESVHAAKKRVAATPYSMASMAQMSESVQRTEEDLIRRLEAFTISEAICDLGDWLHYFAFDVLGEIAFSRKFGFIEAGYDIEGAIKTIDDSQWYNGIVGQVPFVDRLLRRNPLRQLLPFMSTKHNLITRMALEELEMRKRLGKEQIDQRQDLLSQLMAAHRKQPDRFTEQDVFAVSHGAIFAGSDSTASTMQSFFYHVLREPRVYERIESELNEAGRLGKLSEPIQYQESLQLHYFQAALKEAMRIRPAVGLNITRHVPSNGAEIDGTYYSGGTVIALNGWVLHRDKETFGDDAGVYRPERWLEDDAKNMDRYMYQFGGGTHLCIGRNLALLEINMVVPQLLRRFHFKLADPKMVIQHRSTFFVVQSGLKVYLSMKQGQMSRQ